MAQTEPAAKGEAPKFESCRAQVESLCGSEKIFGNILKCLKQNESSLPLECKQEIQRLARATEQVAEQVAEQGKGSLATLGGMSAPNPPFPVLSYEGRYSPGDVILNEHRANIATPIYKSEKNQVNMSLAGAQVTFGEDLVLGAGTRVPKNLYRAEVGTQYTRQLGEAKSWGLRGSVGSASDQLFENSEDTTFSLLVNYNHPATGKSGGMIIWNLFISNNSPIGNYVPIPGITYLYRTPTFTGLFGFPILSLQWTPTKDWAYSFSALGPSLSTELAYGNIEKVQVFAAGAWNNQSFILVDRQDDKDRLTSEEKKVGLGLRTFVFSRMKLETQAGHSFDRTLYIGDGFRNMRRGSVDLDAEWFWNWSVKTAF